MNALFVLMIIACVCADDGKKADTKELVKKEEKKVKDVEKKVKKEEKKLKKIQKKAKKEAKKLKEAQKKAKKEAKKGKKGEKKLDSQILKDLYIPKSVIETKKKVIEKIEKELKITGAQSASLADKMLQTIDFNSVNPAIEKAKKVAKKVKKAAKIAAKHTKSKICGAELINLAKMYDNRIKVKQFDMKKLSKLVDDAVIKITAAKKVKEAKKLIEKSGIKKMKGYKTPKTVKKGKSPLKMTLTQKHPEVTKKVTGSKSFSNFKTKVNAKQALQKVNSYEIPKPDSALRDPLKQTLSEEYPEIANMIPPSKSFIDLKVNKNAKQLLQNKVINNV